MNKAESVNIVQEKWDFLIILDACRYDYFEQVWKDFLPAGTLTCRWSPGSCTDEWRNKTFPDFYEDIVYISANPHICSNQTIFGYRGEEHFFKIHEIWKNNWDSSIGTVLPSTMTNIALDIIRNNDYRNKRIVIHYLQPHAPYLSLGGRSRGHTIGDIGKRLKWIETHASKKSFRIRSFLFKYLYNFAKRTTIFGNRSDWMLRKLLRLPPKAPMEHALRKHSIKEVRDAYQENLKAVLSEVSRLIESLSGVIVVTADHGEFLGENKRFSHPNNESHPIVREVPWLIIEQQKKTIVRKFTERTQDSARHSAEDVPDQTVIERLKSLGYLD